jgi:hypothetical protein
MAEVYNTMKTIHNHLVFLDEKARNDLHEGKEVQGQGFITSINMKKKKLDFSWVNEVVSIYKINSNAKKSEVVVSQNIKENLENENFVYLNFNSKKLQINMDDILNIDNEGKEKLVFSIMDKDSVSHICLMDIKQLKNNYVFFDEISSFSEPLKTEH